MTNVVALALSIAVLILGGGMLLAYVQMGRQEGRSVAKRVDRAIHVPVAGQTKDTPSGGPAQDTTLSWLPGAFVFGIRRKWGMTLSPTWTGVSAVGGAAVAGLVLFGVFHLPLWAVLPGMAAAGFWLPRYILLRQQRLIDRRFMAEFPDAIDMMVRMVRSGLPVAVAISSVGQKASPTVASVFNRVADRCAIGVPLEAALSDMSEEIGLADFRFFAVTLGLQRTTGGNLARTLETFSEIIRKRRAIRLKATAATAEVRMSGMILGGIPFAVIGPLAVISPDYLAPMMSDPRGNVMMGVAMLSLVVGVLTMRWLVRSSAMI